MVGATNVKQEEFSLQLRDSFVELSFPKGTRLTIDLVRRMTFKRLELQKGKYYPILVDATGIAQYYTQDTSRYMAGEEANSYLRKVAVLFNSPSWFFVFKVYLAINPSVADINGFLSRRQAIKWLKNDSIV